MMVRPPSAAIPLVLGLLLAAGCAPLAAIGIGSRDPMKAEMERLEQEEARMAHEQRLIEEAEDVDRVPPPQTVAGRLKRGDANLASGQVAAAVWDYVAAHRLDPDDPAPRVRLGYVHLRVDPERARPLFESALELDPDDVSAQVGLGLALFARREREEGLQHLERAVEIAPDSPTAQAALGVSLDQIGRHRQSLEHLERAQTLRPRDGRILNNLGVAYLRTGAPERAEDTLRAALRVDRQDLQLRTNNLGLAIALQGRFDEALERFHSAGTEQQARSNLGYAHYLRGEYDAAIAEYERALVAGGEDDVQVVRNLEAARKASGSVAGRPAAAPALAESPAPSRSSEGPPDTDVASEFASPPQQEGAGADPWFWDGAAIDLPN
jgi:Flp pilus assembly protein TadD